MLPVNEQSSVTLIGFGEADTVYINGNRVIASSVPFHRRGGQGTQTARAAAVSTALHPEPGQAREPAPGAGTLV